MLQKLCKFPSEIDVVLIIIENSIASRHQTQHIIYDRTIIIRELNRLSSYYACTQ